MKLGRTVQRKPDEELVSFEELASLVIQKDPVGLQHVGDPLVRRDIFLLQLDDPAVVQM